MYAKYCAGIPNAQALYEKKLTEKQFVEFEKGFKDKAKPTLDTIMRPVQVCVCVCVCVWGCIVYVVCIVLCVCVCCVLYVVYICVVL